jgi:xanthine dehydrogenase accessory factor
MTYSHKFDFDLCHAILSQPHRSVGVIGSGTKYARFKSRLAKLGHGGDSIGTLICPIGDPNLGNEPKAIAIGVATQLLNSRNQQGAQGRALNDVN